MDFLTEDYQSTIIREPKALLSGLNAKAYGLAGLSKNRKQNKQTFLDIAQEIDDQSKLWKNLSDKALRGKIVEYKAVFRGRKRDYETLLPQALGAIREASQRCLGLRPYVVQLAGALVLYRGYIAEMATGEGKTLTAGLTAVLNGWVGLPFHIVTVNDYLAGRDAEWLTPLYNFCGVSVGCVTSEMEHQDRRKGYANEITYTTSKEIVADFLRDRLQLGDLQKTQRRQIAHLLGRRSNVKQGMVMRGIYSAVIDEADSILIDEAVTPLIISHSRPNEPFVEACTAADQIASTLKLGEDYTIDHKYKEVSLTDAFKKRLTASTAQSNKGKSVGETNVGWRLELIQQAMTAREFFHRDEQYVIQEGKVVIVDEFTGRLMPQRSWQAGLHQLIEAKEKMSITPPTETLARLSFQKFYRFFHKLSGMTGTAEEASSELWQIYDRPVISIPENKPCQRKIIPIAIFPDQDSKWKAVVEEIQRLHEQNRPVLVGTRSVKASETLAQHLEEKGMNYRLLNALNHEEEARIISHAGESSAITISTNMAGRGTDIRLGAGVAKRGGLHVIATECHESARIDRQLFGRCARQGDPGSAQSFVSLEDELIRRHMNKPVRETLKTSLKKDQEKTQWIMAKTVWYAQLRAQRLAFKRRKSVLRMDTWLEDSLSFAESDVS